ncbi:hypothetical protein SI859A1_02306 [Aurantimonas manganoxydans SI85-9A1]|uniref:Uncharacterized protein n=2 Tax=Aurantimonas manganoxydans TaxID=651183 RepID=Q1YM91_AURMS|nr:hypothetical protein SI859A1_02306 [Aurantimonas manganoxydans SI85-9A1]
MIHLIPRIYRRLRPASMHTATSTMKPQSKPFTVAVKRRKLSPEGKKKSVWSDVSHLIAAAESDLARDEYEAPAAAATKARAKAESSAGKSDATPSRQPRILQSRPSEPVMAEPEADPEPVERPVRRRGRPRKTVAETPQRPVAVEAESQSQPQIKRDWSRTPAVDAAPVAPAPVADLQTAETSLAEIETAATEARPAGRRRQRTGGLRAGERWKRHLPRWSR